MDIKSGIANTDRVLPAVAGAGKLLLTIADWLLFVKLLLVVAFLFITFAFVTAARTLGTSP